MPPAAKKPDPRIPVIADLLDTVPPSTARYALYRAGLGRDTGETWLWAGAKLKELALEELQLIQRILARSTHIEPGETA